MAHYQIFIPDSNSSSPSELERVGLGGLCEDAVPQGVLIDHGPDNKSGVIFAWNVVCPSNPESQPIMFGYSEKWQKWESLGDFYIGFEPKRPITPFDINRTHQYPSFPAMLGDGNQWQIPVTGQLPNAWGCDASGSLIRQVQPKFREYCALSERVFRMFYLKTSQDGSVDEDIPLPDAWDFCCRALALNYRLTPQLIGWLALISDENFVNILMASVEFETILRTETDLKKKADSTTPDI